MTLPTTTLGRTGLTVSVAGLGCGGHSRLGTSYGRDFDHAVGVVRRALELGVNFIDTATNYQTEPHVGAALADVPRDSVVISSKCSVRDDDQLLTGPQYIKKLEASLKKLNTDYLDIYHLHGLRLADVDHALQHIVPALEKARQQGKLRHLAVSEFFIGDPAHQMLQRILPEDVFDVVMVGFNLLNPSARRTVLPLTQQHDIGTLDMFAVRRALTRPEALRELLDELIEQGKLDPQQLDEPEPLAFLGDVVEAGYRFCRHEPGIDVVLFGTGNVDHLADNLRSLSAPPLPADAQERLAKLFGEIDSVSGN